MAKQIIECVPNISEGARLDVVDKVADRIRAVKGVRLLNVAPDATQNRTVQYGARHRQANCGHRRLGACCILAQIYQNRRDLGDCRHTATR